MKNKGKIILSAVGVVLSIALLVISAALAEEKIINPAAAILLIAVSVILAAYGTAVMQKKILRRIILNSIM